MLAVHSTTGHLVKRVSDDNLICVQSSSNEQVVFEQPPHSSVHVTDIVGTQEAACRFLDAVARRAFTTQDLCVGSVDVIQAAAGSGKSTANIKLAQHLLDTKQILKALIVAFNRQAVIDGSSKTAADPRITWKTLDSLVYELYKQQIGNIECTDLDDVPSIAQMGSRVLGMPLYEHEAEKLQYKLSNACQTGDASKLVGDALTLYNKGMQGHWWCYSLLRLRAQNNPNWTVLLQDYPIVFVDEAQDINGAMFALLQKLHSAHHMVYTMDTSQKLYGFMNCINILHNANFKYKLWRFYLTYRHGYRICEYVNDRCLSAHHTYPAENTPDTQISYIHEDDIVTGSHTVILISWRNILTLADKYLLAGRKVRIDEEKRKELLAASQSKAWTKFDRSLFKQMNRAYVEDIVSRMQTDDTERADDEIYLTTVHGYKGLEAEVVRVMACVTRAEPKSNSSLSDVEHCIYVAVTRVKSRLYLPGKKQAV